MVAGEALIRGVMLRLVGFCGRGEGLDGNAVSGKN